jgi:hypothetical protein
MARRREGFLSGGEPRTGSISASGASVLQLVWRFFHLPTDRPVTVQVLNDPVVDDMAERVRAVITRQPGHRIDVVAQTLRLSPQCLEQLMANEDDVIDTVFLIDVIAALVHEAGIDPKWLLTGQYDPAMHRKALLLGEDRSPHGARVMRRFIDDEYRRVRNDAMLFAGTDLSR